MFDLITEIGETIRNNKVRTALTGIAVAWGIFMLIVLLGVARGVVNSYQDRSSDSGTKSIRLWSGYTSLPYKGYSEGRQVRLRDDDMQPLSREVKAVSGVAVSAGVTGFTMTGPKDYAGGSASAVFPYEQKNQRISEIKGRFINQRDIDEKRRTVVVSRDNAELLFGNADSALGRQVKALNLAWTVVGVYDHRWRKGTFIPYTTYKAITGSDGYADEMTLSVDNISSEQEAIDAETDVRNVLARRHEYSPDDKNAVWIWNRFAGYLKEGQAMVYLNIAVWVIGFLTLLTGIVGVSNIMFVSVRERVHEIGIRRAIGARPRDIIFQVLAESVAITTLSGYIGVVAGMALLQVLKPVLEEKAGFLNPTIDISIALEVTVTLIITGALAGLFPAVKATKVKPVEALRDE